MGGGGGGGSPLFFGSLISDAEVLRFFHNTNSKDLNNTDPF